MVRREWIGQGARSQGAGIGTLASSGAADARKGGHEHRRSAARTSMIGPVSGPTATASQS